MNEEEEEEEEEDVLSPACFCCQFGAVLVFLHDYLCRKKESRSLRAACLRACSPLVLTAPCLPAGEAIYTPLKKIRSKKEDGERGSRKAL